MSTKMSDWDFGGNYLSDPYEQMHFYSDKEAQSVAAKAAREGTVPDLWMICRQDSSSYTTSPNPKKLYASESMARRDAEQLCRQENKPFYLLRVVGVVRAAKPPVEWTE